MSRVDPESNSFESSLVQWTKTTSGLVLMLLAVQFLTGTLLAFYYVPSVDNAHLTVSFIERVLSSGAWLRSLHHYGSQWLSLFAFLHVVRLTWQHGYRDCRGQWIASVLLFALVMAAGGTGYSLPWDTRAFFSTRVAEGLVGGLPIIGKMARLWLLGSNQISTLTLSRFFALHVLVTPFLILLLLAWRLRAVRIRLIPRQFIVAGLVFLALALWALKNPAPLGPSVAEAGPDYLPRPGSQFLWLYETLKYVPGGLGSIVGLVLPAMAILILVSLPWLKLDFLRGRSSDPQRLVGLVILSTCVVLVVVMTSASYISDRRDQRTREQLARQAAQEEVVRHQPFSPVLLNESAINSSSTNSPPPAYIQFCANCHGLHGEGGKQGALKFPPLKGVAQKQRRAIDDIVALLNDPKAYGLEPPMRSFATKLTDDEKRAIAEWVEKLQP